MTDKGIIIKTKYNTYCSNCMNKIMAGEEIFYIWKMAYCPKHKEEIEKSIEEFNKKQ